MVAVAVTVTATEIDVPVKSILAEKMILTVDSAYLTMNWFVI